MTNSDAPRTLTLSGVGQSTALLPPPLALPPTVQSARGLQARSGSAVSVALAPANASRLSFRQMHEQAVRARQWALQIHIDYLQPNAVYQINIDSDLAKMVAAQIAQVELWQPTPLTAEGEPDFERAAMESASPPPPPFPLSSLYQQTALSVFNLMETDSFRRFLLTSDFQLLLQRADDAEVERVERQNCMAADTNAVLASADAALHAHAESASSLAAAGLGEPARQVAVSQSAAAAAAAQAHDSAARSR